MCILSRQLKLFLSNSAKFHCPEAFIPPNNGFFVLNIVLRLQFVIAHTCDVHIKSYAGFNLFIKFSLAIECREVTTRTILSVTPALHRLKTDLNISVFLPRNASEVLQAIEAVDCSNQCCVLLVCSWLKFLTFEEVMKLLQINLECNNKVFEAYMLLDERHGSFI